MNFQEELTKIKKEYVSEQWKARREDLKRRLTSRPIILYGLGFFGGVIVKNFMLEGMSVKCFCDTNKRGVDPETKLDIISPQELVNNYSDANIVISVANPLNEKSVYETIVSLGIPQERIFYFRDAYQFIRKSRVEQVSLTFEEIQEHLIGYERVVNLFSDPMSQNLVIQIIRSYLFHSLFEYELPSNAYFPEQFLLTDHEVFVDGGLYIGDTTENFIERVNKKYSRIVGFDIDEKNLSIARQNLKSVPNVEIVSKGLWDCSTSMHAELGISAGSNIKKDAGNTVDLISLDEYFQETSKHQYPSFIKLDIEGSERQALLGAERIIKEVSPKLAVCVYHKPEDLYVLPEVIQRINPNYKFFLRHYSPYIWDSVLYAY